jgi:hypothetical protein
MARGRGDADTRTCHIGSTRSPARHARQVLRSHGEDDLAERVASITDDELTRIGRLGAYYAFSEEALTLGASMGGARALSLASIHVLDGTGRDLRRHHSDRELEWGWAAEPDASSAPETVSYDFTLRRSSCAGRTANRPRCSCRYTRGALASAGSNAEAHGPRHRYRVRGLVAVGSASSLPRERARRSRGWVVDAFVSSVPPRRDVADDLARVLVRVAADKRSVAYVCALGRV